LKNRDPERWRDVQNVEHNAALLIGAHSSDRDQSFQAMVITVSMGH
jgi:hypothetical protein